MKAELVHEEPSADGPSARLLELCSHVGLPQDFGNILSHSYALSPSPAPTPTHYAV